jgi:multiple sugar transport system substrate-binding protein
VIMQTRLPESEGGTRTSRLGQEGIVSFPIPAGPGGSIAFVGGSDLAIPKGKARNANAAKLLLYLTRSENIDKYTKRIGFLPSDREVMESWAKDPVYRVVADQVAHGRSYPNLPAWENIEALLVEMFSAVWTLADTAGLANDEDLYKILVDYSGRVDKVLGVENSRPAMTFAEFRATGKQIPHLVPDESRRAPAVAAADAEASHWGLNTWMLIVAAALVGVVLAGVAVVRLRRD